MLSSESVKSFDVSKNFLTDIKELIFKDYPLLETLSLSENTIEWIDSRAFYGLKMLKNIDLSHNNLRFINATMFSDTPLLQTVSFRGNPLVSSPDFSPILASPSIMSLDLSYCSLTSVNLHTFSQLPSLQVLDLNSNNLREFNRDILNTLTEIAVIDFGNNLWNCDSDIVDVLNWLSEKRQSKGLLGEHKPVKCVDAEVLKTIWPAANKNESYTGQ
jgi:Leucine-rich repeat (LRR) protein